MTSPQFNYSYKCLASTATTTLLGVLFFFLLILSSASIVLSFKDGHAEHSSSSSSTTTTQAIQVPEQNNNAPARNFQEVNNRSRERETTKPPEPSVFIRFLSPPPVPNTLGHHDSSEKTYHYIRPHLLKKQKIASLVKSGAEGKEPSSVYAEEDDDDGSDFGSSMYYTTGSGDVGKDNVDFVASKEKKRKITSDSFGARLISKKDTKGEGDAKTGNRTAKSIEGAQPSADGKPTLVPATFLNLAAIKSKENSVERRNEEILKKIENFWKNFEGKGNNNQTREEGTGNVTSVGKEGDKDKPSEDEDDEYEDIYKAYVEYNSDLDISSSLDFDYHDPEVLPSSSSSKRSLKADSSNDKDKDKNKKDKGSKQKNDDDSHSLDLDSNASKKSKTSESKKGSKKSRNRRNSKERFESVDENELGLTKTRDNDKDKHDTSSRSNSVIDDYLAAPSSSFEDASDSFHNNLFHTTTTTTSSSGSFSTVIGETDKRKHRRLKSKSLKKHNYYNDHSAGSDSDINLLEDTLQPPPLFSSPELFDDLNHAESDRVWSIIDSHFARNDLTESVEDSEQHEYFHRMALGGPGGFLKRELWTVPLFILASLNMILIILFEVYVLCRARGQSRRHLFLGQMLLFGLFSCSFIALMFAVHPSFIGCFVGRLGVGITYSLIFSVLMVKCVFLLSMDAGVYLPTSYQGILLFFAVMVQVALDIEWVVVYPPFIQTVESGPSVLLQCGTSFSQLLYSLTYVGFLVVMVGFLAGRAAYKGVEENFRENVYILITAIVTIPVALSWTVAGWMLQGRHQDACVSFGLVAHSLVTFLIMFMPKGRQLAKMDKEAGFGDTGEDKLSGYSPSFFHTTKSSANTKNYKSSKWGEPGGSNLYTTLEPTVSTINPNVFFHNKNNNDIHSGMIY